ncbi:helix-turn-helix domain-containing protein [Erythrobacter sp. HA6-11]
MQIIVRLDNVLMLRNMTGKELASRIGISETQMSLFRSGKVRGVRFETIAKICEELDCQPGDLMEAVPGDQG